MQLSDTQESDFDEAPPVFAAFGDLMACLFGLFVLFFVWLLVAQVALTQDLEAERASRTAATIRLDALESVLAGPLETGLVTLVDGRIGIRGSVLFELNEATIRRDGKRLLRELAPPLRHYLEERNEALMVSGFTDDLQLRPNGDFEDNWELSAQRALTVTRELIRAGVPRNLVFAAGFGEAHPVAPNDTDENRARNRRVEISPVPRPEPTTLVHRTP